MSATSSDDGLAAKFAVLLPLLDERQRRLLLGAEALRLTSSAVAGSAGWRSRLGFLVRRSLEGSPRSWRAATYRRERGGFADPVGDVSR